ncbi:MAG TPA: erythromycin esterase family protein [Thermoanaerobaculia bacterium]|nr:erythromycin esterase family protein [Thermoanaerobaculia bacterium]
MLILSIVLLSSSASAQTASIEGRVLIGNRPVASALVAAVPRGPREWWTVAAVARSDRDGGFRITGLAPGQYAVTATSDRFAAGHVDRVDTASPKPVIIAMERSGHRLTGRVRHADGQPLVGRVHAARLSSRDGDVFVAQTDEEGGFSMLLPRARYRLFAEAADGMSEAAADLEDEDAEVNLDIERVYRVTPPAVAEWIRTSAIRFDDKADLRNVVGTARIVALGEATHGTHEFFQLKHRMLEFLVREMGFSVFALEVSAPQAAAVDEFVLNGKGDAATVVAGLDFAAWRTAEVLEMVRWMRVWNEDPRHTNKVRFHGFDMQNPGASIEVLRSFLSRVDPGYAKVTESLEPLVREGGESYADDRAAQRRVRDVLDLVERRMRERRDEYAAASSQIEWAWARRQIDLIRQGEELLRVRARAFEVRDRWMGANVKWILDHEPAGSKMVLWAHNGHVTAEAPRYFPGGTMGMHLRRIYGDAMRIFGFAFDRGSFRAGNEVHDTLPAKPGSFDGALASAGLPLFVLDLRSATGVARRWVESPLEHRSVGLAYNPETPGNDWVTMHPVRSYDAVIFVSEMTPTR